MNIFENFDPSNFVENLDYMGTGMAVIGVVMVVLILVTSGLNYLFNKIGKK